MKTKALFGRKYMDIQIRDIELPALLPDQVLVKVHACGVCGTDLNFIRDLDGDYQPMGHEISAEIIETGSSVKDLTPGTKVIVEDCTMCGRCKDCKAGHPEFCRNMYNLNGIPGMGEYLIVHASGVVPFDGIDHKYACLTEPLAVAYNAVQSANITPGARVLIPGTGPIGLLCAALCRLQGASWVGMSCRNIKNPMQQARAELAYKLGCDLVVETKKEEIAEAVLRACPGGVDRVIVTSPPESVLDGIKTVRYGGEIIFLGLSFAPGKNIIDFDVNHAIFNKITLRPSFAEPALNFPAALALIKSGLIPAELFQTHFFSFKDHREVFQAVLNGELPVIKPVFLP